MLLHSLFRLIDRVAPARIAHAHCDVPCGIYDPNTAQNAAHTVIRMNMLIQELPKITAEMTDEQRKEAVHKLARYTEAKEKASELCKHEVRILWGDYFKPEHLQKYPDLHELVWRTMKLGSKTRQEINLAAADELLETVNKIAELFWETKGLGHTRFPAPNPTGRLTVYPTSKK